MDFSGGQKALAGLNLGAALVTSPAGQGALVEGEDVAPVQEGIEVVGETFRSRDEIDERINEAYDAAFAREQVIEPGETPAGLDYTGRDAAEQVAGTDQPAVGEGPEVGRFATDAADGLEALEVEESEADEPEADDPEPGM